MKRLLAVVVVVVGIFVVFPSNPGPMLIAAAAIAAALAIGHILVSARALIVAWRRRVVIAILILPVLIMAAWAFGVPLPWQIPATCVTIAVFLVWRRWMRNADAVTRWGDKARRKSGVASAADIWRFGSRWALRRKATVLRPAAGELTRWVRLGVATTEYGYRVARAGFLRWIWTSAEMVTLLFGGPRMGKTGWLAGRLVDAPGAALVASTRGDLYEITAEARAERGPVVVFNAVGLGGIATTLPFDPLTGCEDPTAAFERATDMLPIGGGRDGDREYWNGRGRSAFAAMLHAAALGGATMADVAKWVADPERHKGWMTSCLRRSPQPTYVTEIEQFVGTNDKTRTSITSAITPALGWLTSPAACAAAKPGATIDVADILRTRTTIYLIGAEETQSEALVSGLTGYITREARRLAGYMPNGRLDPWLSLVLDEAGILAPRGLPSWTSDMGGRGVSITAAFQSHTQMLARWTDAEAGVILNNAGTVMLFGGSKNDDLDVWARLAGDRDEEVVTADEHGRVKSRTVRKVPVFAPAQITNLRGAIGMAPARVIVFQSGMPAALASAQMLWQRPGVRLARRVEQYQAWRRRRTYHAPVHSLPSRPTANDGGASSNAA